MGANTPGGGHDAERPCDGKPKGDGKPADGRPNENKPGDEPGPSMSAEIVGGVMRFRADVPLPPSPAARASEEQIRAAWEQVRYSADYSWVKWGDMEFRFTATQRLAVRYLFDARRSGEEYCEQSSLLDAIDSRADRLRSVFRDGKSYHPAWGTMIVGGPVIGTFMVVYPGEVA
jgi:hypothetical protein